MEFRAYIERQPRLAHLKEGGSRGEFRGTCPFHVGTTKSNFSVNSETGLWICRSGNCRLRGSFPLLYKLLEGIESWQEVRKRLDIALPIRNWGELLAFQSRTDRVAEIRYQELPSDALQRPIAEDYFPRYLSEVRSPPFGFEILALDFNLRYSFAGEWRGRILFPFYDIDHKLLTFTGRITDESTEPRYRFPEGASTSQFLYGVHRIREAKGLKRLWIVEGQFDVLRLACYGEYAVGLSTSTISNRQALDLRRIQQLYGCDVYVMLDRGAFSATQHIWSELRALGMKRSFAIDISPFAKDMGACELESFRKLEQQVEKDQAEVAHVW
jgi:hypothetical protein